MKHIDRIVTKARQAYLDECTAKNLSRNMSVEAEAIAAALAANLEEHGQADHDLQLLASDYLKEQSLAAVVAVMSRILARIAGEAEPREDDDTNVVDMPKPRKRKAKAEATH